MEYCERLRVPLRWWAQGTMLVASFWLALAVSMDDYLPLVWTITAVILLGMAGAFRSYGAVVAVKDGRFRAGRAHIGVEHLGQVTVLDREEARRAAGVDADARAHLVLRPYLHRGVKVEITDPADPTPYWLVHSRDPEALARALRAATAATTATTAGR